MSTLLVTLKNKTDIKLANSVLKKMGFSVKLLSEDNKEDAGMLYYMNKADRSKKVSRETVLQKLMK